MSKVTRSVLESKANTINKLLNSPLESSRMVDGKWFANVGNFHISGAYGGYSLHRMVNESGGCFDVLTNGHISAKELAGLMSAFIYGLQMNAGK